MKNPGSIWELSVFVDTSAFFASLNRTDRFHRGAAQVFAELSAKHLPVLTSNLVVAETYALIARTLGTPIALRWVEDAGVDTIYQNEDDHHEIVSLLRQYADKRFSYTDAFSFVLMDRLGVKTAFTFDADFRQYGFEVIPG